MNARPFLGRVLPGRQVGAGDPGIVDEDVDASALGGAFRRDRDRGGIDHVDDFREHRTERAELVDGFLGRRDVTIP